MLLKRYSWAVLVRLMGAAMLTVGLLAGVESIGTNSAAAQAPFVGGFCPAGGTDLSVNLSRPFFGAVPPATAGQLFTVDAKVRLSAYTCDWYALRIHMPEGFALVEARLTVHGQPSAGAQCDPPAPFFGAKVAKCLALRPIYGTGTSDWGDPAHYWRLTFVASSPGNYSVAGTVQSSWQKDGKPDGNPGNDTDVLPVAVGPGSRP